MHWYLGIVESPKDKLELRRYIISFRKIAFLNNNTTLLFPRILFARVSSFALKLINDKRERARERTNAIFQTLVVDLRKGREKKKGVEENEIMPAQRQ